jgi:acetolactate synthase-1/2/3 large subunit
MIVAEMVMAALRAAGARCLFGVPGGGSSLELMAAARAEGMAFYLARTETGAAIMAGAMAELSGAPCPVLTTRGPGVSAAANGLANASLERAPVVLLADGFSPRERAFACHQYFDHAGLMRPVTKAQLRADTAPGEAIAAALQAALTPPLGPVLLEITGEAARAEAPNPPPFKRPAPRPPEAAALAAAQSLIAQARRPVIIAGLEALPASRALRALAEAMGCPVLVTYKAKGVLADAHPLFGGVFTGGAAEAALLHQADLILLAGADPVEFVSQPWRYAAPVIDVASVPRQPHYFAAAAALHGDVGLALAELTATGSDWRAEEIARARHGWAASLTNGPSQGNRGISPQAVVELAQAACREAGRHPRVSVDAGAHMFPCTSFWQAEEPGDLLISNGLASMGFALPAGIAAALYDPQRGAIAFTGDGGLLMCLGELATAATLGVKLTVVVFNDATLSLIDIKKGERALPEGGLDWPMVDFAAVMQGCGGLAFRADDEAGFAEAMAAALAAPGVSLVDARVDPASYPAQIKALRG